MMMIKNKMTYRRDLRLTGRDDEMTILFFYLSILRLG